MNRPGVVLIAGMLVLGCAEKELGPTFKTWRAGDTVPGYVLREPSGSAADVEAKGELSDGWWKLEVSAPLAGVQDDHLFELGTSLTFSLYLSNGDQMDGKDVITLLWTGQSGLDTLGVYDLAAHGLDAPVIDGGRDAVWDSTEFSLLDPEPVDGDAGIDSVYLHGAHDSTRIYFFLSWYDGSADVKKDVWTFDGLQFGRSGHEDMVVFIYAATSPPPDWDSDGAGGFFPEPGYPSSGEVNVWLWGAGSTNPMGYADDRFADTSGCRGDGGEAVFTPNYAADVSYPLWVQDPAIPPSFGEEFLLEDEAVSFEETLRP